MAATSDSKPLRGPRQNLLEALVILDGRAPTPTIEEAAVGRTGTTDYYLDQMVERGLVEREGKDWSTGGAPAKVYRITDRGEEALAAESDRGESLVSTSKLKAEVDSLRATVNDLEEQVDELAPDDHGY
jgi:DNA-binding PadR family transcriptional regulator